MRMILRQFSKCLMSRSCRKQVILLGLRWIMVVMKKTAVFFKKYLLPYFILMRFHRPVGVVLLLWPTLWALWIAGYGHPSSKNIIIFLLGVIVTRAAGCFINFFVRVCAYFGVFNKCINGSIGVCGGDYRGDLSFYETLYALAAGSVGYCVFDVDSHGVCRTN